jgi:hypothetical protein
MKTTKGGAVDEYEGLILVDIAPGADEAFDRDFLERIGHRVAVCHGPEHATLFPLLAGHGCAEVEGAHGIVFALDLDRAQHRAILRRYREVTRPEVPIRAIVSETQAQQYAELLAGIEVWTRPPTAADLDGLAAEAEAADRV